MSTQQVETNTVGQLNTDSHLVRRLPGQLQRTIHVNLSRRRSGALIMAVIAVCTLQLRRMNYDLAVSIFAELAVGILIVAILAWRKSLAMPLLGKRNHAQRLPAQNRPQDVVMVNSRSIGKNAFAAKADPTIAFLVIVLLLLPWIADRISRALGGGNGTEIVMLGTLAWGAVAAAVAASASRIISISVICSGFLTLFATFISDTGHATWFAYLWGILCLWWLVSNHWETVETLSASHTEVSGSYRLIASVCGCLVFFVVTAALSDRVPVLRKIKAELMPTSGGTSDKDSVGRGVGNGDAIVAAQNNPTSFAAVETDMFLESTKPSLFDVVGEELGVAKPNRRTERAQALSANDVKSQAGNFAEANQSTAGAEFSTERHAPKQREKPSNIVRDSIMFWSGCSNAHLAVERFRYFDGVTWHNRRPDQNVSPSDSILTASMNSLTVPGMSSVQGTSAQGTNSISSGKPLSFTPQRLEVDEQSWFYCCDAAFPNHRSPFVDAVPEAVKFTRFRSSVIPTRQGLQMWSVDRLDLADFFAIDGHGIVSMPGRLHVPDYTVVRMINSQLDMDKLESMLTDLPAKYQVSSLDVSLRNQIDEIGRQWVGDLPRGLPQIEAVLENLREQFIYDRDWRPVDSDPALPTPPQTDNPDNVVQSNNLPATPLQQFLESRRGPSYLFATLAAQVIERLGYETRLATGFYTNPEHFLSTQRETAILPQDAHVWAEVHLGGGYWMTIEPTPGYLPEPVFAGWWYLFKKHKYAIATSVCLMMCAALVIYMIRGFLLEVVSRLCWPLVSLLSDRRRIAWLARLIDLRSHMAGIPRAKSTAVRMHLQSMMQQLPPELNLAIERYCQIADRVVFGYGPALSWEDRQQIKAVWRQLKFSYFRKFRNYQNNLSSTDTGLPSRLAPQASANPANINSNNSATFKAT